MALAWEGIFLIVLGGVGLIVACCLLCCTLLCGRFFGGFIAGALVGSAASKPRKEIRVVR